MTVRSERSAVSSKALREKRTPRRVVVFIWILLTVFLPCVSAEAQQPKRITRAPAMYFTSEFVEAGGLMSYAPNFTDQFRRAATYVDKILKGRSLPNYLLSSRQRSS
jgi:hypothetical protein